MVQWYSHRLYLIVAVCHNDRPALRSHRDNGNGSQKGWPCLRAWRCRRVWVRDGQILVLLCLALCDSLCMCVRSSSIWIEAMISVKHVTVRFQSGGALFQVATMPGCQPKRRKHRM